MSAWPNSYQQWREKRREWIQELRDGDITVLSGLYMIVSEPRNPLLPEVMAAIAETMEAMDINQQLAWDNRFRDSTSMEWSVDWCLVEPEAAKPFLRCERDYLWLLRLGTLHPNGYYREKCLMELSSFPGELDYILLRTNDWVGAVRELAMELAKKAVPESDCTQILRAIPFLEKAKRGGRRDTGAFAQVEAQVAERIVGLLRLSDGEGFRTVTSCDLRIRQGIYRMLLQGKHLTIEEVDRLLSMEKSNECCTRLIRYLLYRYPYDEERVEKYLQNKNGIVRKYAVECKYEYLKDAWDGLEEMLLDSCRGVREYAAYILQRCREMDVGAFYRECLRELEKADCPEAVIIGLGEYGESGDSGLIIPYLRDLKERIVKAALFSLSKLVGQEGAELYWPFLLHEKPGIVREAYRAAVKSEVHYGAERLFHAIEEAVYPRSRFYLTNLLCRESGWESLPWLLRFYRFGRDDIVRLESLQAAFARRALHTKISAALEREIREVLADEENEIPQSLAEQILFDLKYVT
ncbi:MAG: hypothetical protein K2O32_03595 [Acetatifactor sp.]|nr:hypothetical protein [Acetatifactor sp.]